MLKQLALAAFAGAALGAAACAPIEVGLDNPLSGAQAILAEGQTMTVRMSNVEPALGEWRLAEEDLDAVVFEGKDIRPPAAGVRQIETFNFTAAAPGTEDVTLLYAQKDGYIGEQVTINVAVR